MFWTLTFLFTVGACVGSFLGVCIDRIPKGKSVVIGRSRCQCGAAIPPHLNVPILSWIMLRGRARCCGALIPFKFFLAELLSAIFLPLLFLAAGKNITVTAVHAVLLCTLLVASFIDIDTLEIPDCLSVGLATVGMLTSAILPEIHGEVNVLGGVLRSACGLLGGTGILFWIAVLGEQIFKKEAIGLGDVKLVGAIGTFCGVGGALWAIFGGAIAGTIVAIPLLIRKYSHGADTSVIAFVPFLSVGTLLFIFFGGAAWL